LFGWCCLCVAFGGERWLFVVFGLGGGCGVFGGGAILLKICNEIF